MSTSERPVLLVVTSDLHCGSTIALAPPQFIRDDGEEINANRAQLWLWDKWKDFWRWAEEQRSKNDARLWWVQNGDMTEGMHHGSTQTIVLSQADEARLTEDVLDIPLALDIERKFIVRGTPAHVGGAGSREELVAVRINADRDPDQPQRATWYHLRLEASGVKLDFAHHGKRGGRPWTEGSAINLLAADISHRYIGRDWIPDLAIRSHVHLYKDSYNNSYVRVITTPAWQLKTEFIHKIAPDSLSDIGGLAILCDNGEHTVKVKQYAAEKGTVWTESLA